MMKINLYLQINRLKYICNNFLKIDWLVVFKFQLAVKGGLELWEPPTPKRKKRRQNESRSAQAKQAIGR